MENISETCIEILKKNDQLLLVDTVKEGKMLIFITPTEAATEVFQVAISHKSLENLRNRIQRNIFEWEIKDKSVVIKGKDDKWRIKFISLHIANLSVELLLSIEETIRLKKALLDLPD